MKAEGVGSLLLIKYSQFMQREAEYDYDINKKHTAALLSAYEKGDLYSGKPFKAFCTYIPSLYISLPTDLGILRMEFCLDCGQSKVYLANELQANTDFYPGKDFLYQLVKQYHKDFNERHYR